MGNEIENLAGEAPVRNRVEIEIKPLTDAAREYLTGTRGLSERTLEAFGIGCNDRGNIVLPFKNEKGTIGLYKVRHATGGLLKFKQDDKGIKSWCSPNGRCVLGGSHLADPSAGPLVLCFGDYDAPAVYEAGVPNCVSMPYGDSGFQFLDNQWDFLKQFQGVVIFNDADTYPTKEAEARAKEKLDELAQRLGKHRCKIVRAEDRKGTKDANELLIKHGKEAVANAVENAQDYPLAGLISLADHQREPPKTGISTGFTFLDRGMGGFAKGHLVIVGGDNAAGKTTLILNLIANFAQTGTPSFFWSGEQAVGKLQYAFERIVTGADFLKEVPDDRGFNWYFPHDEYDWYIKNWYRPLVFVFKKFGVTQKELFEAAELAIQRHGCKVILIDNLMAFTGGEGEGYYQAQGDFAESCKMFAETWGVTVILVVHNRKLKGETAEVYIPTKDDIEGSKKIQNWADAVLQLVKLKPTQKTGDFREADGVISLCKNRESGLEGTIQFVYDPKANRIRAQNDYSPLHYKWEDDYKIRNTENRYL